jgi:HEAT repeat protein
MQIPGPELTLLIEQLRSRHSPKRRSAALKLRKLGNPAAGPALLDALANEWNDRRTWETQYQMVMALGHSGTTEAIPLLEILAHEKFPGRTMVLVAIGDALVRLSRSSDADAGPVLKVLSIANDGLLHDGALRAVAMLRMRFNEAETADIIRAVDAAGVEGRRFWLIAACPGWSGVEVDRFVERCLSSTREDVRAAAADAKLKKYRNWRPL